MSGEYTPDSNLGVWIGDCTEAEALKRLDRLKGELREAGERFQNRIILERDFWPELYVHGRLSFIFYFKRTDACNCADASMRNIQSSEKYRHAVLVLHYQAGDAGDVKCRDNEFVFVDIVQLAQFPNTKLTSLIGLYFFENEVGEVGDGFFYRSVGGRFACHIVPFFAGRQINSVITGKLDNDIIKRASKVMNSVPDNERDLGWIRGSQVDLNNLCSGFRVFLNDHAVEVCLQEGRDNGYKLIDMAVGPLNL